MNELKWGIFLMIFLSLAVSYNFVLAGELIVYSDHGTEKLFFPDPPPSGTPDEQMSAKDVNNDDSVGNYPLVDSNVTAPTIKKGAINPKTGEHYPPAAAGGVINPETGEFYPKTVGGYINPETGEIFPPEP
jgi:hypothetical protein